MKLRAPFPWFGGKSRAASLIWPRFGDASNYIEPFAGSLAVLLARPHVPRVETVNDVDAYLANFWRAVAADPKGVAHHADWPVNEADLHARHRWLVESWAERIERIRTDPDFFDAKVAGWWVWGQCLWIGSGWCARPDWTGRVNVGRNARGMHTLSTRNGDTSRQARRPHLTHDQGVNKPPQKMPQCDRGGRGIAGPSIEVEFGSAAWQQRPDLTSAVGRGVFAEMAEELLEEKRPVLHANGYRGVIDPPRPLSRRRPNLGGAGGGQGVQAPTLTRQQIPQLSGDGSGSQRGCLSDGILLASGGLYAYMQSLATRLRRVRVCCGDWTRVLTPAVTTYIGTTAILLDPPYQQDLRAICYSHDTDVSAAVRAWALEHGDNPKLRIALCGYEGEHEMPGTWECVSWKAGGGYGRSARGKANRHKERIWFSPHCLKAEPPLFAETVAAEVAS